jgi:hypothetical protein
LLWLFGRVTVCLLSVCDAALAELTPSDAPPLANASPEVPTPPEAGAIPAADRPLGPAAEPSLGPAANPAAPSPTGPAVEPAADADSELRAAPTFELQARVISGFEEQRSRPSGDQSRPAEKDFAFQLHQARIELDAQLNRFRLNLSLDLADALASDIAGGYDSPPFVRNATLEYRHSKALRLLVGRYKRPFSRIELTSAADLPVLRRGLLNGLVTKDNQWGDRALGAMLSGRLEPAKLRWYVSLTNPDWSTSLQSQGVDVIARVQLTPIKALSLGLDGGYKYLRLGSQAEWTHNFAMGGDVGWKVAGVHLLLEGHFADLPFETGRPEGMGALLLADYVFELSQGWSLQPMLFAELADANAKVSETESVRFAAGLNLLVDGGFRVLPQVALVRSLGQASQQNPWLDNETYSLVFSLAL